MARGLKTRGMIELGQLRRRVRWQHAHTRISKPDADYLVDLLDKFEAHVVNMEEKGE